jgi:hypothetical protein
MRPTKQGRRSPDQNFDEAEKLYRRVPRECVGAQNELEPSCVPCSFGKVVESAPSVVREKYGTAADALNSLCAGGRDVSSFIVFYLRVRDLPKGSLSGDNVPYDFYPFHNPLATCYAHTVVACKKANDRQAGAYKEPTRPVKNDFKAKFVAALKRSETPSLAESLLLEVNKYWAALRSPRS